MKSMLPTRHPKAPLRSLFSGFPNGERLVSAPELVGQERR